MTHQLYISSVSLVLLFVVGVSACGGDTAQEQDLSWQLNNSCQGGAPCPDMNADLSTADMSIADTQPDQPADPLAGMALIPEGPFQMGTAIEFNPNARLFGEWPVHEVYLSTYAIDIHEVTVKDYKRCVDQGACKTPRPGDFLPELCNWGVAERADHPINCVDWFESKAYCQWLGKTLPTEAQWEKAARGPNSTIYPWGDEPASSCDLAIVVTDETYKTGCGTEQTWPVGSRPKGASVYGVMDLIGNVQEWPNDLFEKDYYGRSEYKDPQGPADGLGHALRGGSFAHGPGRYPHSSVRDDQMLPEDFNVATGFRCAKNL